MLFEQLAIDGAMLVRLDKKCDERGFFARTYCSAEFAARGLPTAAVQSSISFNLKRGTIRGLHFQWAPSKEGKLVRCSRGELFDVLLDLRPSSPSFLKHASISLTADNRDSVYIPPGVAHGFQTLRDDTEVHYQMTDFYDAALQSGVRWSDPAFAISWPLPASIISERDATYADFSRESFEREFARRALGHDQR